VGIRGNLEKWGRDYGRTIDISFFSALRFLITIKQGIPMLTSSATTTFVESNAFSFGFFFIFSESRGRKDC
jgi:hypothetical protein